jgi:7-carboxy-7-deazaguanine synthase
VAEKTYRINEAFYSPQGEGVRAGTMNVFVRFSGCNRRCDLEPSERSPGGFACDTEFESGRDVTLPDLAEWAAVAVEIGGGPPQAHFPGGLRACRQWKEPWLVLTGGEPALQLDREFCTFWHDRGVKLAVETNGTLPLPTLEDDPMLPLFPHLAAAEIVRDTLACFALDWITSSPKVAEHAVKQHWAHELKYVRGYGQAIPKAAARALHYLISPAFDALDVHPKTLGWCQHLVAANPEWRLTVQIHKLIGAR